MKRKIVNYILIGIVALGLAFTPTTDVSAQCPMCKMSAESNLRAGGSAGKGLNAGILYLLATPYVLIGVIGFIYVRGRRLRRKEEEEEALESLLNDVNTTA